MRPCSSSAIPATVRSTLPGAARTHRFPTCLPYARRTLPRRRDACDPRRAALRRGARDGAPDAARLASGEADLVALRIDALAHRIDPAKTQRLIDGLRPGHAGLAAAAL